MVKKKATRKTIKKSAKKAKTAKVEVCCTETVKDKCKSKSACGGCSGFVYFLGFLGAAIYYISTATGFWNGVWGVIKALVWPALLMFELFKYLGM